MSNFYYADVYEAGAHMVNLLRADYSKVRTRKEFAASIKGSDLINDAGVYTREAAREPLFEQQEFGRNLDGERINESGQTIDPFGRRIDERGRMIDPVDSCWEAESRAAFRLFAEAKPEERAKIFEAMEHVSEAECRKIDYAILKRASDRHMQEYEESRRAAVPFDWGSNYELDPIERNDYYADVYDAGPKMVNLLSPDYSGTEFMPEFREDVKGLDPINDRDFYAWHAAQEGEWQPSNREAFRLFAEAKPEERAAIFEAFSELTVAERKRLNDEAVGRHQGWGRGEEQHPTVRDYLQAKAVEKEAIAQKATQPPQQVETKAVEKEATATKATEQPKQTQADIKEASKPKLDVAATTAPTATELAALGLGPARSRSFVSSHPETAAAIVDFAKACEENGARFKVFQSSGRNGYYAQLRLKVITGEAANAYTDSRGYEGPSQVCEVGSMSTTKTQARGLDAALTSLAKEAEIPFVRRQAPVAEAKAVPLSKAIAMLKSPVVAEEKAMRL